MDLDNIERLERKRQLIDQVIQSRQKRVGVALALAIFLPPVGVLYANVLWGVVFFFIGGLVYAIHPLMLVFFWLACLIAAPMMVTRHNEQVASQVRIEHELKDL